MHPTTLVHKLKNIASKLPKKAHASCFFEAKRFILRKIRNLQPLYIETGYLSIKVFTQKK
jgi:hypothetical protein